MVTRHTCLPASSQDLCTQSQRKLALSLYTFSSDSSRFPGDRSQDGSLSTLGVGSDLLVSPLALKKLIQAHIAQVSQESPTFKEQEARGKEEPSSSGEGRENRSLKLGDLCSGN